MRVKFRITIFFTAIVFVILIIVCLSIYYFAYHNREHNFKIRLSNRAETTARLLSQDDIFSDDLIRRIDTATAMAMSDKTIQAYDYDGALVYEYKDAAGDTFSIRKDMLENAKRTDSIYFKANGRDVVACHFSEGDRPLILVAAAYDTQGWDNLEQLRLILLGCFFGGIIITVAAGYFFSQKLLRPIRKIADEVNEITAQNLTKRIKSGERKDEWNYLAQTLNVLLNRLEESFDTQGRFISNASHELSTPLTSIFSQLEVSLQKERDAIEYRKVMQSVLEDVNHLNKLTHTLLQFARASGTSGGPDIYLIRIDEILLRMPGEMSKLNTGYHVKLSFTALPKEEEGLLVLGNEGLIFSAIRNIVLNACKYSADNIAILELSVTENKIIVNVADRGDGIPPEDLEKIFQPFYRSGDSRGEAGFGLGLSLAARIVKLHRGEIKVSSIPGEGTSFSIILPIASNM
jgi:two-component system, OmpR family, sensor histidine kinase ArlS